MEKNFNVGDKVILIQGYWNTSYSTGVVSKVYKNGNFVLEGSSRQYRQNGYATGEYSRSSVEKYTPERWEECIKPIRVKKKRERVIEKLGTIQEENVLDKIEELIGLKGE